MEIRRQVRADSCYLLRANTRSCEGFEIDLLIVAAGSATLCISHLNGFTAANMRFESSAQLVPAVRVSGQLLVALGARVTCLVQWRTDDVFCVFCTLPLTPYFVRR